MARDTNREKKVPSLGVILAFLVLFLAALVPRVLSLNTGLIHDEDHWILASSQFISGIEKLDFQDTDVSYHPGVTTAWLGGIALRLKSYFVPNETLRSDEAGSDTTLARISMPYALLGDTPVGGTSSDLLVARLSIALATSVMILGIFFLIHKLFNRTISLLSTLLIAFDPFYIAHSRLIHTDALVTSFMVLSVLGFLVYLEKGRMPFYAILSGISCGAACLTKTTASFLFPFALLVLLLHHCVRNPERIPLRFSIRMFLGWAATSFLTFCVLWPKIWVESIHVGQHRIPFFPFLLPLLLSICYWGIIKQPLKRQGESTTKELYRTTVICTASALLLVVLVAGLWETTPRILGSVKYFLSHTDLPQVLLGKTYLDPGPLYFPVVLIMKTPPLTLILLLLSIPYLFHSRTPKDSKWILFTLWLYVILFDVALSVPAKKLPRYLLPVFPAIDLLAAFALYYLVKDILRGWMFIHRKFPILRRIGNTTMLTLFTYSIPVLYQAGSALSVHPYYIAYNSPIAGGRANAPNVIKVGKGEEMGAVRKYLNSKGDEGVEYIVLYVRFASAGVPEDDIMRYYINEIPEHVVKLGGIEYAWIYRDKEKEYRSRTIPDFLAGFLEDE